MSRDRHNDGQEDRAAGRPCNLPHGIFEDLTTWTDAGMHRITRDNTQYRKGWDNTDSQTKD